MSALPITPPATRPVPGQTGQASPRRTRLRLVASTPEHAEERTRDRSRDLPRDRSADDDGRHDVADTDAPTTGTAPGAGRSLAPRTRAQALRRRAATLLVGGALVGGLVAGVVQLTASSSLDAAATGLPMVPASVETVVVQPGQTVWSIAATHAPAGTSTADYAAMIVEHNGLAGGDVDQWQVLRLPTP